MLSSTFPFALASAHLYEEICVLEGAARWMPGASLRNDTSGASVLNFTRPLKVINKGLIRI